MEHGLHLDTEFANPPQGSKSNDAVDNRKHIDDQPRRPWTPFFLRRELLFGFMVAYIAIILALAIIYWYSESHRGLITADPRYLLLWQYTPTAGTFSILFEPLVLLGSKTNEGQCSHSLLHFGVK